MNKITTFLRYPGSKRRMLDFLSAHIPAATSISGRFIEPFVGGGAIYFHLRPRSAVLADINKELIDLYRGIRANPSRVWHVYRCFPNTKRAYKQIRNLDTEGLSLSQRAARSLYLNRTCFKGMWRHNLQGKFNIGYGGQSRRWSIRRRDLVHISSLLKRASLRCLDFEPVISEAKVSDYLFLDPPYRPGKREQLNQHYSGTAFAFEDHQRLASCLKKADKRGIRWGLTISSHRDIVGLYKGFKLRQVPRGTGPRIGEFARRSGEVLICNS
jgi:DNA adenine methylase